MKNNFFSLLWFILAITAGILLYHTSDDVHHAGKDIHRIDAKIAKERHAIAILTAEFYTLTTPPRLEKLAKQYLPKLEPVTGAHLLPYNTAITQPARSIQRLVSISQLIERTLEEDQPQPKSVHETSAIYSTAP